METTLLDIPCEVFSHIFRDSNCEMSTRYIMSMVCKTFHLLFLWCNDVNFSHVFLKEDNILWYRNRVWNRDDIPLHGGVECLKHLILNYNPSSQLYQIYRISASKGYLTILQFLDDYYSKDMKLLSNRTNLRSSYEFLHEYAFVEHALVNLQFHCCDYLYAHCKYRFHHHGIDELPDDMPIACWEYLLKNHYVEIEEIRLFAEENNNAVLLDAFSNKGYLYTRYITV
jgi:hypothetical protein